MALEDRCAHRMAPLSRGRVEGDRIVCGYHGLEYGPDGKCAHNPYGKPPALAKVRRFPLVEKHQAMWIWMGEAKPDESQIPDFSILDVPDETAAMRRDHVTFDAPWDLISDNLIDLSHVSFLHAGILGNAEMVVLEERHRGQPRRGTRRSPSRATRSARGRPACSTCSSTRTASRSTRG